MHRSGRHPRVLSNRMSRDIGDCLKRYGTTGTTGKRRTAWEFRLWEDAHGGIAQEQSGRAERIDLDGAGTRAGIDRAKDEAAAFLLRAEQAEAGRIAGGDSAQEAVRVNPDGALAAAKADVFIDGDVEEGIHAGEEIVDLKLETAKRRALGFSGIRAREEQE